MKKLFLLIASATLIFAGCGDGVQKSTTGTNVPQGMTAADLTSVSEGRMTVLINVPDSTVAPLEIIANAQGGADIMVGKNFQISVTEGEGNMALKKSDITNDDVRKFIKYSVEDQNAIVWEWMIEGMEPEFHFYAIVKAGDKTFEVRNIEGEVFSEKSILQMLDAARSLRMKEKS